MGGSGLIKDYTSGPVTRQLLAFAWPFMLSNLLQTAYNLADMMAVGRFTGPAGLSAVSAGAEVLRLYTYIAMGFCSAGQVLISQYVGLGDKNAVARLAGAMFTLVLGLSLAVTAAGLFCAGLWPELLRVPEQARRYCRQYTVCCTAGLFFIYGYNMISAILRGMGDSRRPLVFIAVAAALNVALDVVLVGHGMGPLGAAVATVASQGVSFAVSVVYLWRRRRSLGFDFRLRCLLPDKKSLRLLLRLGVPMAVQSCAICASSLFVTGRVNAFGLTASAVTGVGAKLSAVAGVVTQALSQAGATMVGQNFAARKFDRVEKILRDAAVTGGAFAALLSAVVLAWPEGVFALFSGDPAVLSMSRTYAPVAVLNFFAWASRGPSAALCNGMGFPAMNFFLGLFDGVVMCLGLSLLLGEVLGLGLWGYWLGGGAAGYAFFLVMLPYFLSGRWKRRAPPAAE